jgi:hypothetical protein
MAGNDGWRRQLNETAEVAFQRAALAAKYVARKLAAANSLEYAPATKLIELAELLEAAQALYDALAGEDDQEDELDDPALGDTQVAQVDAAIAALAESLERSRR